MKTQKLALALLAGVMVVSVAGAAVAAPNVPGAVYGDQQAAGVNKPAAEVQKELDQAGIKDVKPNDYFAGSVTVIVESGLLAPKADGNFHPEATLNASEGVAVFAKVLGVAAKDDTPDQALTKAKEAGLVGDSMTAETDLTRMEVARMLAKALGVKPVVTATPAFADATQVSSDDAAILQALYELGIFKGYEDHTFRPDVVLTRAQIAILIDRILGAGK